MNSLSLLTHIQLIAKCQQTPDDWVQKEIRSTNVYEQKKEDIYVGGINKIKSMRLVSD